MELYKLEDRNRQRFLKLPKDLFLNDYYRENLSSTSKLVYGLLLDRMELSRKNEWVNSDNEIYLLYTKESIAKDLDVSERTIYNSFNELEDLGLIKQERQGLNKPNKIFIGKTNADAKDSTQPDMKRPAGQDVNDMQSNETDCSETSQNNTYISPYQEASREGSEAMNIYLKLFEEYVDGKHGNVKRSTYDEASAKLQEHYLEWDEESFIGTLREYFEDDSRSGLPKLSYFCEVADRFLL